ncbi:hypothetical protein FRC12_002466 [Ceratobasidium sp. 428]|nr:hypothetical protein FRC12_002466 [Ceratobasidium sp. 428]
MVATKRVWLSNLKFAGLKPLQNTEPGTAIAESSPPLIRPQTNINQTTSTRIGLEPYERIASEKPGEELAPNAAIWEMYVEEAREQDKELVDGKNRNLDQMLLFATLFSAILTAFIIESKNLLEQDSADLTVTLLLAIAQSQQRMEQNAPQTLPSMERPPFSVPITARWINGLWYTSLALSLSAALIALLAKEWLSSFISSRPRSPRKYALSRQMKYQGISQWKALHIINLLPTLLHFSLLLFSLGLVTYLWTLDSGAAIAVAIITTTTALFYLVTAALGAIYSTCPFDTQVSKYIHILLVRLSTGASPTFVGPPDAKAEDFTTDDELDALKWLAEKARDHVIGDCAYQALAGLRIPEVSTMASNPSSAADPGIETPMSTQPSLDRLTSALRSKYQRKESDDSSPPLSARHTILNNLCGTICTRLEQAITDQPRDVTACLGSNLAQYASSLPVLVRSLETYMRTTSSVNGNHQSQEVFKSPGQSALAALDSVWSNDCPELHPDSYAMLIGVELRVLEALILAYRLQQDAPTMEHETQHVAEASDYSPKHSLIQVDFLPNYQLVANAAPVQETARTNNQIPQFELRARYSRALFRAAFCLSFHNNGRILINSYPLEYLLDSLLLAAQCAELNPESCLSTHRPQSEDASELPMFYFRVIGTGLEHFIPPMLIGDKDGLLAGLVGVLSAADIEATPLVEYSAGRTLWAVGPMLLRQWLQIQDDKLERYFREHPQVLECVEMALSRWPKLLGADKLYDLTAWTLVQLLIIATIMVALADSPYGDELPRIAIAALYRRAAMASGRGSLTGILCGGHQLINHLFRLTHLNCRFLGQSALDLLLRLFLIQSSGGKQLTAFSERSIPADSLVDFLSCLCKWPGHVSEVQKILAELQWMIRQELYITADRRPKASSYALVFERQSEGFSSLARLAEVQEYTLITVDFIRTLAHNIVHTDLSPGKPRGDIILACTVPGLLNCVSIVFESTADDPENMPCPLMFALDVVDLLEAVVGEWSVTENLPAIEDIEECLAQLHEACAYTNPNYVATRLKKVRTWVNDSFAENEPDLPDIFKIRIDDDTYSEEDES